MPQAWLGALQQQRRAACRWRPLKSCASSQPLPYSWTAPEHDGTVLLLLCMNVSLC